MPALTHVQMAHAARVGLLVVGSDAVLLQQRTGAGGQLVHPRGLQLAVGAGHNAVAAPGKKAGHNMPVLVGAHGQLDLVAVAVRVGCAQHVRHRYVQLAQPRKGVPYKLGLGGALGLIADMPQTAAAAGAGHRAVLPDAARPGGQQLLHAAESIAFQCLYNAAADHIPRCRAGHKNGLPFHMGNAAAIAGKVFDRGFKNLIFLQRHGLLRLL